MKKKPLTEELSPEEVKEFKKAVLEKNIEELLKDTRKFLDKLDEFEEI